ncbi:unnamed protein product [Heligmosomoides polygyrus]|uniref:Reverse transcriptase domain-containing protein n=1 Tax=Heligmosomoides polygyrus TaxID=6339 RepID=A0A183GJH3_HELPZ|nr:unnamed protein product [Heligmosomoides polygyrus]
MLGVPLGQKLLIFAFEQVILDFERLRKPSYALTVEANDEEVLERSRADLEELKESLRRKEQRRRDPT